MSQPTDLPVRCSCGVLRGVLRGMSSETANRCVCYCDDCQSFAHFLEGDVEILDANGGTDIFQMWSGRLEITEGAGQLACMRLTETGMFRWYARCCKTPIGNTPGTSKVPFVGLIHSCISDTAADGRSRDETLGPIRMRGFGRYARGDRTKLDAHDGAPVSMVARLKEILRQAQESAEESHAPFFDPTTGEPTASPIILSPTELNDIETARDEA